MDSKYFLDSTTIRNLIIAIAPPIAGLIGMAWSDDHTDAAVVIIGCLVTIYGVVQGMRGRVKADQTLRFKR
jgi:1,4-dihydroxy-2-naphthoate octaprenyltransferase